MVFLAPRIRAVPRDHEGGRLSSYCALENASARGQCGARGNAGASAREAATVAAEGVKRKLQFLCRLGPRGRPRTPDIHD